MPDWLTYVASAAGVYTLLMLTGVCRSRRYLGVAAVGSLLPDIVKISYVLRGYAHMDLVSYFIPFHTAVGSIVFALLLSHFFDASERRKIFLYLSLGVSVHILWDLSLHPYGGGQLVFFPLSFSQYSLGLFWADSIIPLAISSSSLALVSGLSRRRRAANRG